MRIRPPDWDIHSIRFLINSIYCYNIHFLFRVFSSQKRRLICELFVRLVRLFLTVAVKDELNLWDEHRISILFFLLKTDRNGE